MIVYKGKEYTKAADVVREQYDLGLISLSSDDKKRIAEELGIASQSVHATIMRHIGQKGSTIPKKVKPAVKQVSNKVKKKLEKVKSDNKAIFINDYSDDEKEERMKDTRKIKVDWAPNQWGLPITSPPMYVIDENFDPQWTPPPEEEVERIWE